MNGCNNSCVELFWSLRWNVLQLGIRWKWHCKWLTVIRALLNYFYLFEEMVYNSRFVESHIRNEWCEPQFFSAVFIISRKWPRVWNLMESTLEMNDSNHCSVQLFSSLRGNIRQLVICRKSQLKRMILIRIMVNYVQHFEEMCSIRGWVENHIRNELVGRVFCWSIFLICRKSPQLWL
jgi:hypothetical protein